MDINEPRLPIPQFTEGQQISARQLNMLASSVNNKRGLKLPSQVFKAKAAGGGSSDAFYADYVATAAITLSGVGGTPDGTAVVADDVVLTTMQATSTDNGLWIVKSGAWEKNDPFNPDIVAVMTGTTYSLSIWLQQSLNTYVQFVAGSPSIVVQAAATANIATLSGLLTVDGYTTVAGDLVLCHHQTTAANRKIYTVAAGAWTAKTTSAKIVEVMFGTTQAQTRYFNTATNVYKAGLAYYG